MKFYVVIFCAVLFCTSCKKEKVSSNTQIIKISDRSAEGWNVVNVYSVVRDVVSDSLTIKNTSHAIDTTITWSNIKTADEDAWFVFKIPLTNGKVLKGLGGERDDLPYSKITRNMDLLIYSDSIRINSY